MHLAPDTSPVQSVRKVYFQAFAAQDTHALNPNSAAVGSALQPYPTRMAALLGVWKDCNRDGYVGHPEGVLQWYPTATLLDTGVCPAQATPDYSKPGQGVVFNDGTWVREFFAIGPDAFGEEQPGARHDNFRFNIADEAARVWGDWGLPESGAFVSCPLAPMPRGTFHSTGGMLRYTDCHVGWFGTRTVDELARATGLGMLAFDGAPRERPDQSTSVLNQKSPYGDAGGAPMVTAFECGQPRMRVDTPVGTLTLTHLPLVPPTVDPSGSPAAAVNHTAEGALDDCDGRSGMGPRVDAYRALEADNEGVVPPRRLTDFEFAYREPNYDGCGAGYTLAAGLVPDGFGVYPKRPPLTCAPGGAEITGEGAHNTGIGGSGIDSMRVGSQWLNTWSGDPGYAASRNPYVSRETLQPWGGTYATFYAYVSPHLFLGGLPPAGTLLYGSHHCSGTTPRTGLWSCDGTQWWRGPFGEDTHDPDGDGQSWRVKVNQPYNLRDIDCWDHSLAQGTPGLLSLLGETQCAR